CWQALLKASFGRMEPRVCREHGLLPLPAGERGGVRGLRSRGWFPLTPTLSPQGRGSPAGPQMEAVLITKVWIEMNGTCSSRHFVECHFAIESTRRVRVVRSGVCHR